MIKVEGTGLREDREGVAGSEVVKKKNPSRLKDYTTERSGVTVLATVHRQMIQRITIHCGFLGGFVDNEKNAPNL